MCSRGLWADSGARLKAEGWLRGVEGVSKGFWRAFRTYLMDLGGYFDPALSTPPPVTADDGRGRLADEAARGVLDGTFGRRFGAAEPLVTRRTSQRAY